jgi:hypothetical protein
MKIIQATPYKPNKASGLRVRAVVDMTDDEYRELENKLKLDQIDKMSDSEINERLGNE